MILVESDGKRRVGWQDELGVSLSPVPRIEVSVVSQMSAIRLT